VKIGINTLFLIPGEVGGTETYLRETLSRLAEEHQDLDLVLFTNDENGTQLKDRYGGYKQIRFAPVPCRAANRYQRILVEQFALPRHVREAGVDVLWSPGYTMPLRCPVPGVTTVHDMQFRRHPEDLSFQARVATSFLVNGACRRSRLVLVPSAFSRDEVVTLTGIAPDLVRVTPYAADPSFGIPMPQIESVRRIANLTGRGTPYLLMVSNTYPHKNIDGGLRAFVALQRQIPHDLILVGKPRLGEPQVEEALTGLEDRRRFIRFQRLKRQDLIALYQGAAAMVFPSKYEGFGLPLLEAMLAGTPVIATRCASIPEVGAEHVWTADPDSPADIAARIREVLALDADERARRRDAARLHAVGFSWSRTAHLTAQALREAGEPRHGGDGVRAPAAR
jgi:glycosyltransferase involved in cell wall biosynthesis